MDGDPKLGFAANFLYTLTGKKPDDVMEKVFDVALILHADHELNASTFAARVMAATLIRYLFRGHVRHRRLKGPLHGGANEDVIRMLLDAGDEKTALAHVQDMLANKKKIPGFGHRVYHTEDPRATHLRAMSEDLGTRTGHLDLYLTSKKIEETIKDLKRLNANVDFYSASTYYSLGIPIDLFTPIFAVSRMSGWTAHVLEQYRNNRLIRPRAEYTGKPVGEKWIPIAAKMATEQRVTRHARSLVLPGQSGFHRPASGRRAGFSLISINFAHSMLSAAQHSPKPSNSRRKCNAESAEIGKLRKAGVDTTERQQESRAMDERISALDEKAKAADESFRDIDGGRSEYSRTNPCPVGKSADDNVEVRRWGQPREFDFAPKRIGIWGPN